ncbi:FecCD family ABC transporter permease [Jatrophihabitans sp. YIM 134969]
MSVSRTARVVPVLLVALLVLVVASLAIGSDLVGPGAVWDAVRGTGPADTIADVRGGRWPRTLLALLVGAALAVAGTVAQGHTRNPLADPGLLGIAAGAAFAVVAGIYLLDVRTASGYVWLALAGAFAATVAVAAIAARSGGVGFAPLALAGAAVTALLVTGTSLLVLNDRTTLDVYRRWVAGSLAGRDLGVALDVAPFLAVGAVLAVLNAPGLNALTLGADVAVSQGHDVGRIRLVGLLAVVLLSGGAVAAAGPIGFLGLAAPHIARRLVGGDFRRLVPVSGLVGSALLLAADIVGRVVITPSELQVGIVLAIAGGPVFIAVARSRRTVAV